ncbi:hypothetical protein CHARACLAT_006599 [Characodon lateralis]|uniref:Uncharacterized protein n=1 Tax=Characodon lateralis TaxID=208331 RepID=A0ABU7EGW3_9TELE|nr:hypothetical protein [Characodon lateralis]
MRHGDLLGGNLITVQGSETWAQSQGHATISSSCWFFPQYHRYAQNTITAGSRHTITHPSLAFVDAGTESAGSPAQFLFLGSTQVIKPCTEKISAQRKSKSFYILSAYSGKRFLV